MFSFLLALEFIFFIVCVALIARCIWQRRTFVGQIGSLLLSLLCIYIVHRTAGILLLALALLAPFFALFCAIVLSRTSHGGAL